MAMDSWRTATCPMSSAALLATAQGVRGAWETDGRIRTALLGGDRTPLEVAAGKAKHPALAVNAAGECLVAWAVGTGWNRGGTLAWTTLDGDGQPTSVRGTAPGVSVWSLVACYAEAQGGFVILR